MKRRIVWIGASLAAVGGAIVYLVAGALGENLVYFLTPSELVAEADSVQGASIRLGGRIVPGSVSWNTETTQLKFRLADSKDTVWVVNSSSPPAMFQEGRGVVVEGTYTETGVLRSDRLMVKHSNEYKPPDEESGGSGTGRSSTLETGSEE